MGIRYETYGELPVKVRDEIMSLYGSSKIVDESIPALGNRSMLELINEEGEEQLVEFLLKVRGKFT